MEEEIDKVKTWADENDVQPEGDEDKPTEATPPAEEAKPEEKPLEGEKESQEPEVKPEGKKDGEGEGAKGFGIEGHTPKGVQERFNEMSRSNRELKERNAALEARIKALEDAAPKPKEKDRNDFANDEEWINYISQKKATEMFNKNIAEWEFKKEMEYATPLMQQREDEARSKLPDFDEVMSRQVDLPVDRDTYLYVANSEKSAMINYTLRKVEAVRQQFINTPIEKRKDFVRGIEARLKQIDAEIAAKKSEATNAKPQNVPPAEDVRHQGNSIRQPMDVKHNRNTRLDPATCSMDEWMENGD